MSVADKGGEHTLDGRGAQHLALFVDYENVAIGADDAGLGSFDVRRVLARAHEKGRVVLKRAYADWTRYSKDRRGLHESGVELVEVPHASYSGKNSADIRLVVDALDLCHSKGHVDVFVIVSGDSDFSPLVSKLRENACTVVGVGVRASTSRLLVECCDEFVFYDDLHPDGSTGNDVEPDEALDLVVSTAHSLLEDRSAPVWGSHVKQVIKRKRPQFSESRFGYSGLNALLEAARDHGLVELRKDQSSGGYQVLSARLH